jgi:uncharacterized protein YkwD
MPCFALRVSPAWKPLSKISAVLALTALFICVLGDSPAQAACASESSSPSQLTRLAARSAVFCLINEQRSAHGLATLTPNQSLGRAAEKHSRTMNAWNFFGHTGDGTPVRRAHRSGYMRGASSWMLGETLAWGRGSRGTPAGVVAAMMASPIHRDVLLNPSFREIGVGVAMGAPVHERARNAAIYTLDLGVRS